MKLTMMIFETACQINFFSKQSIFESNDIIRKMMTESINKECKKKHNVAQQNDIE